IPPRIAASRNPAMGRRLFRGTCVSLVSGMRIPAGTLMRLPSNVATMLAGPLLARVYAALVYLTSLVLVFGAAVLTGTHARQAFIFVFLPGVLLAALSVFIWSGRRAAMILALAVAVAVELMMTGSEPQNWWQFLAVPVVYGALTIAGLMAPVSYGSEASHR